MSKQTSTTNKNPISRIVAKSVKVDFGHDRAGSMCNLYLDNKKFGDFHDDGWGGEADMSFVSDAKKAEFVKFCDDNDMANIMINDGWDFKKDSLNLHDFFCYVADKAIRAWDMLKEQKRIERSCISSLVYGTDENRTISGWKGVKNLKEMTTHPVNQKNLQAKYDSIKAGLTGEERIFNSPEQLTALNITL
jgi:hypothetical protein